MRCYIFILALFYIGRPYASDVSPGDGVSLHLDNGFNLYAKGVLERSGCIGILKGDGMYKSFNKNIDLSILKHRPWYMPLESVLVEP